MCTGRLIHGSTNTLHGQVQASVITKHKKTTRYIVLLVHVLVLLKIFSQVGVSGYKLSTVLVN